MHFPRPHKRCRYKVISSAYFGVYFGGGWNGGEGDAFRRKDDVDTYLDVKVK